MYGNRSTRKFKLKKAKETEVTGKKPVLGKAFLLIQIIFMRVLKLIWFRLSLLKKKNKNKQF